MANPLCKHFGRCGGCSLQHLEYEKQQDEKKSALAATLGISTIKTFYAEPYYYRNRMDFVFHKDGLGLREKGKWYSIVDIKECVIANKALNKLAREVREFFSQPDYFNLRTHEGTFRYAVIRTPSADSAVSIVLNKNSAKLDKALDLIKNYAKYSSAGNIIATFVKANTDMSISDEYKVIKGSDMLKEVYAGKRFMFPVQGFFQNNKEVAEMMYLYSKELLSKYNTKNSQLVDLYGGVGCFGIFNADLFKNVVIAENNKKSIEAANINIRLNNCSNTKALLIDAKEISKIKLNKELFIITDPPRAGMHPRVIKELVELNPKVIIYVSCNIKQLKKDLPSLKGYYIKSAALFDMFPQTPHSEAVIELVKND